MKTREQLIEELKKHHDHGCLIAHADRADVIEIIDLAGLLAPKGDEGKTRVERIEAHEASVLARTTRQRDEAQVRCARTQQHYDEVFAENVKLKVARDDAQGQRDGAKRQMHDLKVAYRELRERCDHATKLLREILTEMGYSGVFSKRLHELVVTLIGGLNTLRENHEKLKLLYAERREQGAETERERDELERRLAQEKHTPVDVDDEVKKLRGLIFMASDALRCALGGFEFDPGGGIEGAAVTTIKREDLIAVLEECEWGARAGEGGYLDICPVCDSSRSWGHKPDCKLKEALDELRKGAHP